MGPYRVERALARGGTAVVYAGHDERDDMPVAIKVPHESGGTARLGWFRREASLAARLTHPGIVRLLDAGMIGPDRPYLVFERIDGPTLEQIADRLDVSSLVAIGAQILDALGYAHDAGVLHCDVKPENVLVASRDWDTGVPRVKLSDFGLAATIVPVVDREAAGIPVVAGTPGYLSPEQARGTSHLGPATDVYGCGALLYRLVAGRPPMSGRDDTEVLRRTLQAEAPPLRPRSGLDVPPELIAVIERMIARDAARRFASAFRARSALLRSARAGAPVLDDDVPFAIDLGRRSARFSHVLPTAIDPSGEARTIAAPATGTRAATMVDAVTPFAGVRNPLVGRERAVLDTIAALDAPQRDVVRMVGPAGTGKSLIAREVITRLRARGVLAYRVTGRRGTVSPPYEVLAALALDVAGATEVPSLWIAAERLALAIGDAGVAADDPGRDAIIAGLVGVGLPAIVGGVRSAAYRAFAALLATTGAPALLVVDDADGIDADSRVVLESLATSGDQGAPSVLLIGRSAGAGGRPPIVIQPMDFDAVTVAPAILDRLARLPHPALITLRAAAIHDGDVPLRALPAIAQALAPELDELSLTTAADDLVLQGLLVRVTRPAARRERSVRFASDLVRAHVLEAITPDAAALLHAATAVWLSRECWDGSPGLLAALAAHAEAAGDIGLAAHALAQSGRLAAAHADVAAADRLSRALALGAKDAEAADAIDTAAVHGELAALLMQVGDVAGSESHATEGLRVVEPERRVLRARLHRLLADAHTQRRELDLALGSLDDALAALGSHGDPLETAAALANKGWILGYLLGENEEGIALARQAQQIADRIDAPDFRAWLCGRLGANYLRAGDWDGQLATNMEDLGLSTRARDVSGVVRAHINLGVCYTNRALTGLARAHTEVAYQLARSCARWPAAMISASNLAMLAADDGRWDEAERLAREALAIAERLGTGRAIAETHVTLARAARARGDLARAAAELDRATALADRAELEMVVRALAGLDLARGDVGAAVERLSLIVEGDPSDPYERACTEVVQAVALARAGRAAEAVTVEARAAATLRRLGGDLEHERKRWA